MKHRSWLASITIMIPVLGLLTAVPTPAAPPGLGESLALYAGTPGSDRLEASAGAAVAAGVDPAGIRELVSAAHRAGIDPGTVAGWLDRAASLAARRLPAAPVMSRYLQGLAKGIPTPRIEHAVEELVSRLERAALHLEATCGPEDSAALESRLRTIDHVAYLLGLGVSPEQLDHSIRLAWETHRDLASVEPPVLTLGILVSSGIPPAKSLEVLDIAWENGYQGQDLERLGKSLGRLGRHGNPPSLEVVNEVIALISKEVSQERVFRGLDDLVGREEYRLTGTYPGGDPTRPRITPSKPEGPSQTPGKNDQQLRQGDQDR